MAASQQETLDYAMAERQPATPLPTIVVATLAFAAANWLAALASDYWYFVGARALSADPGEAAAQLRLRREKLFWNMVPETFATAMAAVVVLCVQWWAWRAWPENRRRTWPLAVAAGVAHCGAMWALQGLMAIGPAFLRSPWMGIAWAAALAAGAGLFLAWWRGR